MGWFWADAPAPAAPAVSSAPSKCPVSHGGSSTPYPHPGAEAGSPPVSILTAKFSSCLSFRPDLTTHLSHTVELSHAQAYDRCVQPEREVFPEPSAAPIRHVPSRVLGGSASQRRALVIELSKLNPLNYMFHTISQERAPNQTYNLPTSRDESSIPKGTGDGNWEYPSPQQMYNALLRKGYTDTDVTAVESMVAVHNFLNEGAWGEVVEVGAPVRQRPISWLGGEQAR